MSESNPRHLLNEDEAAAVLGRLAGWERVGDGLEKVFQFGSYLEGIDFVRRLALAAEAMDHHPELTVGWRRVRVRTTTHRPKGLTGLDEKLAKAAERVSGVNNGGV